MCAGVVPLHQLGRPFSDAEGPALLAGLRFDEDNTVTDRPVAVLLEHLTSLLGRARHATPPPGVHPPPPPPSAAATCVPAVPIACWRQWVDPI